MKIKKLLKGLLQKNPNEISFQDDKNAEVESTINVLFKFLFEGFNFGTAVLEAEKNILDLHLYLIHLARIKLVARKLPASRFILDIGGVNSFLIDMGYRYNFDVMNVIDLPPDERHEMYKSIELKGRITKQGPINVMYGNITNLSAFNDYSYDLIWAGQIIEHITREDAQKAYQEIRRVLKPTGFFCFDTPNRLLTEIHTVDVGGGLIHPEHKIEYYPDDLKKDLLAAGFRIIEELGVCHMPESYQTKKFNYTDFLYGNTFSDDINASYIQYYKCGKE
jgi:SAM-dependent methyltransferase